MSSGPLLVTGRTLLAISKKGVTIYRKARAIIHDEKRDAKKNHPIALGMKIEDVIKFVRISMYKDMNDLVDEDSDSGDDVDNINDEEALNLL